MGLGADGVLYGAGVTPGLPIATLGALCLGGFSAWWSLHGGDQAVLESTRAAPLDPSDPRQRVLDNVVEEIAIAGGIPKPAVYVIPDSDPNAFATGSGPERASIAVTRGLLEKLDRDELQGVVAHELSHVKNYDVRLMTVVAALAGAILLLSDWSRRGLRWGGRSRDSRPGRAAASGVLFAILWIVSIILAPIIAQIVSLAVSRQREYLADASGAELTRNPLGLASALEKIAAAPSSRRPRSSRASRTSASRIRAAACERVSWRASSRRTRRSPSASRSCARWRTRRPSLDRFSRQKQIQSLGEADLLTSSVNR